MACLALFALVVALAALPGPAAADKVCKEDEFHCPNKCVASVLLCNGLKWCDDGSDLAACEASDSNKATLAVGESVAVRATVTEHHYRMYALVCNATECGRLGIEPYSSDDTRLVFIPSIGCSWPAWLPICGRERYRERTQLRQGTYELVLQRRDSKLAVWLADQPDNVGLVEAPDGGLIVRLRSYLYNDDFHVEFGAITPALRTTTVTPVYDYPDQPTVAPVRPLSWWWRQHGGDSMPRPAPPAPADERPLLHHALGDMGRSLMALRAESAAQRSALADLGDSLAALRADFRAFASWAEQFVQGQQQMQQQQQQRLANEGARRL